jgi:hypothetical protein
MRILKEVSIGSKLIKDLYLRDAEDLGRYLISKFKLGKVQAYDSQTPYTVGRISLDYAKNAKNLLSKTVDKALTKDIIMSSLKTTNDAYTNSALKSLGLKKPSKKSIDIKDYNPSPKFKKAVSKFIKDPLAIAIVASWYEDEGASISDVTVEDIKDLLDAASDTQEIAVVSKAVKGL